MNDSALSIRTSGENTSLTHIHIDTPTPAHELRPPPFSATASLDLSEWEKKSTPNPRHIASAIPGRPILQHALSRLKHHTPCPKSKHSSTLPTSSHHELESKITLYLKEEFSLPDLNDIHLHLWWAGRLGNIHSLHDQRILNRSILVTERTKLHLTWRDDTIYIKPLPASLLNHDFWRQYISVDPELQQLALGFLKSYTKLLQYPIDVQMARELHLIPEHLDWAKWHELAAEIITTVSTDPISALVNKRYHYGELRLSRLNHIMIFARSSPWRMYHRQYTTYAQFFSKNFAWLLLMVVYLSVVLTAMQVVVSLEPIGKALSDTCYWFSVGSMVLVAAGIIGQFLVFGVLFVVNFWHTWCYLKRLGVRTKITPSMERGKRPGENI
ncbi:hypothetical protein EX30DRAFT_340906 [Ascodesmis nigricans]|uniref:Uncharacterized protein n=1 Tax=Ascodesmis nigricans TaxID=341454 RepID=A0A4S2MXB2_9PEZI|nr:hypothetical protein EX30DRAFT_340906 [Ascodesmis nigricans]